MWVPILGEIAAPFAILAAFQAFCQSDPRIRVFTDTAYRYVLKTRFRPLTRRTVQPCMSLSSPPLGEVRYSFACASSAMPSHYKYQGRGRPR